MPQVSQVDMQHNGVTALPSEFLAKPSLRAIQFNYNEIRRLPEDYTSFKHITSFQVCYNYVEMSGLSSAMHTYLHCYGGQYYIQRTPDKILPRYT